MNKRAKKRSKQKTKERLSRLSRRDQILETLYYQRLLSKNNPKSKKNLSHYLNFSLKNPQGIRKKLKAGKLLLLRILKILVLLKTLMKVMIRINN